VKLIEGHDRPRCPAGRGKHPNPGFVQVDTTNILLVMRGASRPRKDLRQRTAKDGHGFGPKARSPDDRKDIGALLRECEPEDLHQVRFIREFVGRLPVVATLERTRRSA